MIKYIKLAGYRFVKDYDDLTDSQFALVSSSFSDSESSTFGKSKLDRVEVYSIFVKSIDLSLLNTQIEGILNSAISDGVNVSIGNSVEVENVENGYNITLNFTIRR